MDFRALSFFVSFCSPFFLFCFSSTARHGLACHERKQKEEGAGGKQERRQLAAAGGNTHVCFKCLTFVHNVREMETRFWQTETKLSGRRGSVVECEKGAATFFPFSFTVVVQPSAFLFFRLLCARNLERKEKKQTGAPNGLYGYRFASVHPV